MKILDFAKKHAEWPNNQGYTKKLKDKYMMEKKKFKVGCFTFFFLHIFVDREGRK